MTSLAVQMADLAVMGQARRESRLVHPRRSHVEHEHVAPDVGQAQPVHDVADDQGPAL